MTNGIYLYNTVREEWSASTSPNETPRPSLVHDGGDPTTLVEEASSSSSSSTTSGAIGLNPNGDSVGGEREHFNLKSFSFIELQTATMNFKPEGLGGVGGCRRVYKGWIDPNTLTAAAPGRGLAIAVERLDQHEQGCWFPEMAEVYVGQLYHPNLVNLLGYCFDNEEYLLVYEFMPRESLDNHLFRRGSSRPLSWRLRMKVALGAAKGLAFLHTAQINVMHRGVHCSNILLDSDYNSKLSDFGLAKDGPTVGFLASKVGQLVWLRNRLQVGQVVNLNRCYIRNQSLGRIPSLS